MSEINKMFEPEEETSLKNSEAPDAAKQPEDLPNTGTQEHNNKHGDDHKSVSKTHLSELFNVIPPEPATEMAEVIKRYCVISETEVDAMVLWLIASNIIDDFRIFPKLALISPEKRCGKTTTMEVASSMARDSLLVSNMSAASIYRMSEQGQPTLFIDEADTFLKNGDAEINGLINSSHTKSAAKVSRCVGDNHETKVFSTWMPMVLASIGDLADTLMDRSIVINLRRKKSHEQTAEVPVDLQDLNKPLRQSIAAWLETNKTIIKGQAVVLPEVGNDRAGDNWRPLFKVAEVLGEPWRSRCERAYLALTQPAEPELPTLLLLHIRTYFERSKIDRVTSSSLCTYLNEDDEGPWRTCNNGRQLTANMIAKFLRPYGVKPKTIRVGDKTPRGYEQSQFVDAFERYLP